MMIGNLSTAVTAHKRPTLADIEKRRVGLLTHFGLHSQTSTSPASLDPASPPTSAPSTPEPLPASAPSHPSAEIQPGEAGLHGLSVNPAPYEPESKPEPQHSLQSVFEEYALYGLAGQAVRTLVPHTEAQPEAILLQSCPN